MTLQLFDFFVPLDTVTYTRSFLAGFIFSRCTACKRCIARGFNDGRTWISFVLQKSNMASLAHVDVEVRSLGASMGSMDWHAADTHWYRRAEGAIQVARREATGTGGRVYGCHGEWSIGRRMSWSFPEILSNRIKPKQSKKRCRFSLIL